MVWDLPRDVDLLEITHVLEAIVTQCTQKSVSQMCHIQ